MGKKRSRKPKKARKVKKRSRRRPVAAPAAKAPPQANQQMALCCDTPGKLIVHDGEQWRLILSAQEGDNSRHIDIKPVFACPCCGRAIVTMRTMPVDAYAGQILTAILAAERPQPGRGIPMPVPPPQRGPVDGKAMLQAAGMVPDA